MSKQAERMAAVAEATRADKNESIKFLVVQVRIWRALAIIHAHHPDMAKQSMLRMAIWGTLVGDIESLERLGASLTRQAQSCGETIGVFDPPHHFPKCVKTPFIWKE